MNGLSTYAVPHPNIPSNMTPTFSATMAPDGSLSGQSVNGTIAGATHCIHIEGSITGQGCIYAFGGDRT